MILQSLLYCAGINSFASLYGARSNEEENERAAGITSAVYNNMAACYIRQVKWDKAVYAATKALALAPKNLKHSTAEQRLILSWAKTSLQRRTLISRLISDHKVSK